MLQITHIILHVILPNSQYAILQYISLFPLTLGDLNCMNAQQGEQCVAMWFFLTCGGADAGKIAAVRRSSERQDSHQQQHEVSV